MPDDRDIPPPSSGGQTPPPQTAPWPFLRTWLGIGLQSFGGGPTTMTLIHEAVVDRAEWMDDAEFTRTNAICQLVPGINLMALATLIGNRVLGGLGVTLALAGMLLPSIIVTVLITAAFRSMAQVAAVRAALRGIVPATVGLGLWTALQMARGIIRESAREGSGPLRDSLLILLCCVCAAIARLSPVSIIMAAGLTGAALQQWRRARRTADGMR